MNNELKEVDGKLSIDGKIVLKGWESFSGWYWFGVEKVDDDRWFGFVQGLEEEWGYFSEAELKSLGAKVWEIPSKNLSFSGRRNR